MENTQDRTSITLSMYVDLLRKFKDSGERIHPSLSTIEKRAVDELTRSGLLSVGRTTELNGLQIMSQPHVITPSGIAALDAWEIQIKKNTMEVQNRRTISPAIMGSCWRIGCLSF